MTSFVRPIEQVGQEESDKLLIESFVAIFGRAYCGQKSSYMEKAIIPCWNWLHRIFDNKQKALVEEYKRENRDPYSDRAWEEIKRKASAHTEIILRKFRKDDSDCEIRGYMDGLHEWISKVETGEEQSYFPKEDLPGQRRKALMEMEKKSNPSNVKAKTVIQREAPEHTEVVVKRVITNKKGEQKTVAERCTQTDLSYDSDEDCEDEDYEDDWYLGLHSWAPYSLAQF